VRRTTLAILLFGAAACSSGGTAPSNTLPGNGGQTGGTTSGTAVTVDILDYQFSPATLTIKVGETVRWSNGGAAAHTVTGGNFGSGQLAGPSGGGYGSGGSAGQVYARTFTNAGTYDYHCANHPQMTGTVTLTP
jgi:plastocyanin